MAGERYLTLENGRVFQGRAFGAQGDFIGEIVFTTAMTGYLETLTGECNTISDSLLSNRFLKTLIPAD